MMIFFGGLLMALIDTYQRNIRKMYEELHSLSQNKNKELLKIADLKKKVHSASLALLNTKIASSIQSKSREIERFQNQIISLEKKIVDYDKKINYKNKKILDEEKKLIREQNNMSKKNKQAAEKQQKEALKQAGENERRHNQQLLNISQIYNTLDEHEGIYKNMNNNIKALQNLPEKIVALFLASNPVDSHQLRLDEEARSINEMMRKTEYRSSVVFESRWAVRPVDVLQAINETHPTIVHFSGHGSSSDEIVFQDADGKAKFVSKEAIVQTMMASSSDIRLVFFNTCYSSNQAQSVVKYVEASIGMNSSIGDDAARVFSSQFYSAIGFGNSIGKAFDQAKALLMLEGIKEENTPELFIKESLDPYELVIVRQPELSLTE